MGMSMIEVDPQKFKFYRESEIMILQKKLKDGTKHKFYQIHIPMGLYPALGIRDDDKVQIYVNYEKREILLRLKPRKK
jgi:hypothetical protein